MNLRAFKAPAVAAATALLVMVAAGCTDTTVEPKSTVTGANVFNDPSSYLAFLARVYSGLAVTGQLAPASDQNGPGPDIKKFDEGFSQYIRLYWELEELPTDAAVIGWGDIGLPEMNTMTWTSSARMVVNMYYRVYIQVAMANEFLRQTTPEALATRPGITPVVRAEIQTYRAEARFLRALSYAHAVDLFGNVPLVTEDDPIGVAPKQSSRTELYNYVVKELTEIRDQLPAAGPQNYARATAGAADMLLANLYLNAGIYTGTPNYAAAMEAAGRVINSGKYTLDPNFRHMFMADNNTSPEIIFPVAFDGVHTQTWGGTTFLVHAGCGGNMSAANYGVDYCWGGYRLKPQMYHLFGAGDGRGSFIWTSGQTEDVTKISEFTNGIAAPKFSNMRSDGQPGQDRGFPDTDFPLFRLGEAYLIYAEAALRANTNVAQALQYVNQLRQRAFGNTSGNITQAQLTLQFILDERGRELMFEAHRRTDLIRYGKFTGATYIWQWKGGVHDGQSTDQMYNLYPLPSSEIIANPNLTQNAGYTN